MRAIAAVAVLLTHVSFVTTANRVRGGSYFARLDSGVSIFFVISGFLLYRPFVVRVFEGRSLPSLRRYAMRRVLRIYPAYWIAALSIAVAFRVKPWTGAGDAVTHLLLVHIYSPATVVSGPIAQAWSLGTEVSFYAALPLLALAASRLGTRLGAQLGFVCSLFAGGLAYRFVVASVAAPSRASAYLTWLPGYIDQFALGMAMAVVWSWCAVGGGRLPAWLSARWVPVASWALAFASLSAAAFAVGLPTSSLDYGVGALLGRQVTYGLFGAFVVLPAVFGPQHEGVVRWFLQLPVIRWVGLVSYGVYLWHQFFIDRFHRWTGTPEFAGRFGLAVAVVLGCSVAVATASYVVVERPLLRFRRSHPPAADTVAAAPSGRVFPTYS